MTEAEKITQEMMAAYSTKVSGLVLIQLITQTYHL